MSQLAQKILDEQGYVVLAHIREMKVGDIITCAVGVEKLLGPMRVIALATYEDWAGQHKKYAYSRLDERLHYVYHHFAKIVAE